MQLETFSSSSSSSSSQITRDLTVYCRKGGSEGESRKELNLKRKESADGLGALPSKCLEQSSHLTVARIVVWKADEVERILLYSGVTNMYHLGSGDKTRTKSSQSGHLKSCQSNRQS